MEKLKRGEAFSLTREHKWTRPADIHLFSFHSVFSGAKTVYTLEFTMHLMGLLLYLYLLVRWF